MQPPLTWVLRHRPYRGHDGVGVLSLPQPILTAVHVFVRKMPFLVDHYRTRKLVRCVSRAVSDSTMVVTS